MSSPWQIQFGDLKSRSKHLFETKSLSDCTFLVGEAKQSVEGHKVIVSMASPVLAEKLTAAAGDHPKITITDIEPQVFQLMLKYIYTDSVDVEFCPIFDLAEAARAYQLPGLLQACLNKLSSTLTVQTVLQVYKLVLHTTDIDLKKKCEEFIEKNAKAVLSDCTFKEACPDVIEAVFSLENLDVESELELVNAADRYAENVKKNHNDISIQNVLTKIRFLSLTPEEFAKAQSSASLLSTDDAYAILSHIVYNESKTPMPSGFTLRKDPRKKVNVISTFKPWFEFGFEFNIPDIKNISGQVLSPAYTLWNHTVKAIAEIMEYNSIQYLYIFALLVMKCKSDTCSCIADGDFILRADNGKHVTTKIKQKLYTKVNYAWGNKVLPIKDVLNPKNHYVKDGGITFEIRIKAFNPDGIE